jgi:hypothetical protein
VIQGSTKPWVLTLPPIAAALVHLRSLWGGFTNWDDPNYLLHNPLTEAPLSEGLGTLLLTPDISYSIPVTTLVYAGQRALFDLDPMAFHAVSVFLHVVNVILLMALARRFGLSVMATCIGACVFAVHPVCVEPVAWVVGQKDLLATGLLLGALVIRAGDNGSRPASVGFCVLLCILAMGAKPSAVAAPLLVMALDWTQKRPWSKPENWGLYTVLFAVALAVTTAAILGHSDRAATTPKAGLSSLYGALWAVALQAHHLLAPYDLAARYFQPTGAVGVVYAVVGAAVISAAVFAVRYSLGLDRRVVVFGIVAAVLAYLPVSGLVQITRGPADSYMYAPLALLAFALAAFLVEAQPKPWTSVAIAGVVILFATLSVMRIPVWRDSRALWFDLVDKNPDEPRALTPLANAFVYEGQPDVALALFEDIDESHPDYAPARADHGQLLASLRRFGEAEGQLARAARLGDTPDYRERYAFFLLIAPVQPSDDEVAERAMVELAPVLAERGKRLRTLERARDYLLRFGHPQLAEAVGERMAELREVSGADPTDGVR